MQKLLPVLFILIALVPLAFAGWEATAALAIITAVTILAILYAVGFGFDINELKMIAKEELFQIVVLVLMITVFYGTSNLIDGISTNADLAQDSSTIQEKALEILESWSDDTETKFNSVTSLDSEISIEASKAFQCSLFGMGYSVSSCGAYSMLNPPLGMAGGIIGFAYAEVSGMTKFVEISQTYSLTILLPVGILLRTFKITRGAGGFFIAMAMSLHIMLPLGIIFNEMLAQTFDDSGQDGDYTGSLDSIEECNGDNPDGTNEELAVENYEMLREGIRSFMKTVLLRATLGPVIALLIVMASIRGLSSLMGAEVDVSMIARFA